MPKPSSNSVRVTYPRFNRDELLDQLRRGMDSLEKELPVQRAVLFGSWATGRATAYSDIDLLVVYDGPVRDNAYALVRQHIPIRGLEPHVYTTIEADAISRTLDRMTRDGVVVRPSELKSH